MLAFIALLGGSIDCVLYPLRGEQGAQWLDAPELQGFAGGVAFKLIAAAIWLAVAAIAFRRRGRMAGQPA